MSPWLVARRPLDRIVALPLLLIATPLMLLASLLVVAEDRRKPMLTVRRTGRDGVPFSMPKVRSMRPRTERGSALTQPGDRRVTRVGAILRKLHLDELPQLVPVARGQMSLLGPRPEDPDLVDHDNPDWQAVLQMAPGIAGITQIAVEPYEQQVLGSAEDPERAYLDEVLPRKLLVDRWYVENATPYLDLLIGWALVERIVLGRDETSIERHLRKVGVQWSRIQLKGAA